MDPLDFVRALMDQITMGLPPSKEAVVRQDQEPMREPKWLEPVADLPSGMRVIMRTSTDSVTGMILDSFYGEDGRPVAIVSGLGLILQGEDGRWRKPHSTKLWVMEGQGDERDRERR